MHYDKSDQITDSIIRMREIIFPQMHAAIICSLVRQDLFLRMRKINFPQMHAAIICCLVRQDL